MNGTADKVLAALQSHGLKSEGANKYRCNSPFRNDSDSMGFTLVVDDPEHGAFHDWISEEKGSLYELAKRLGVETPERAQTEETKRAYRDLAEYAQVHGIPAEALLKAGWQEAQAVYDHSHGKERPALKFSTSTGDRYRFIDGEKAYYKSTVGYKSCWYGLKKAPEIAREQGLPLILCNGEVSTVVAQHFGLPACCVTGGEKEIPADLLPALKAAWDGRIAIALDCDDKGRAAAIKIAAQLTGYDVRIIDLNLTDKGDLADFCKLHTIESGWAIHALFNAAPKEIPVQQPELPLLPAVTRVVTTSDENADHFIKRLDESHVMTGEPVVIPMKSFHYLGGYARVIMPGKIVGVLAPSGHGKTTFLETWTDMLNAKGHCGFWHGTEFTPDEYHDRRIQRYGGVSITDMALYELWKKEKSMGIPANQRSGVDLPAAIDVKSMQLSHKIKGWPGKMTYFPTAGQTLEALLEHMEDELKTRRKLGQRITFAVFDYAQLLQPGTADATINRYEWAVELVKQWTIRNCIVSFVGSQVRKTETRDNKSGGRLIDSDGALYLRDDKFNLFITLNVVYVEDIHNPDKMIRTNDAVANVTKNSAGLPGEVNLITAFEYLSWREIQVKAASTERAS